MPLQPWYICPSEASYRSQIKPHLVYREKGRRKCCTKEREAGTVEEDCEEEDTEKFFSHAMYEIGHAKLKLSPFGFMGKDLCQEKLS